MSITHLASEFDKYDEPRLHMERLKRAHLIEFNLPIRILCQLEKIHIRTLGDLLKTSFARLREINQFGVKSEATIREFLAYHGLSLADK